MYQFFLISIILFCLGGAGYMTISHGSLARVYTGSVSQKEQYDSMVNENLVTIEDLEKKENESTFLTIFKRIIGVHKENEISSSLAKTMSGTYSCMNINSTFNCLTVYTFTFKSNSAAVLRISDQDGIVTVTEVGTWAFNDQGQIVVNLYANNQKRFDENRIFTLTRAEQGSELITVEYPKDYYPDILTGIFKFIKK